MKKLKLAKRRQEWVDQFKVPQLKGGTLRLSAGVTLRYRNKLDRLAAQMSRDTVREVRALWHSPVAQESAAFDASVASQARILMNKMRAKWTKAVNAIATKWAIEVLGEVSRSSATALKGSLKEMVGSVTLKTDSITAGPLNDIMTASIAENVGLIKSIPQQYFNEVQGTVMRSITQGNGLQDLIPALEKYEGVTRRRAEIIARDQTRKAFGALNTNRMKAVGVQEFEWVHSGGSQKPRELHVQMSGNVYRFDDPPIIDDKTGERGLPGQLINCGCTMRPIISFDTGEDDE